MLTRVARVIDPEAWDALVSGDGPLWSVRREISKVKAHNAIEAMREPSEWMIEVGTDFANLGIGHAWGAMIDAALVSKEQIRGHNGQEKATDAA